jgi:hypothetical protein
MRITLQRSVRGMVEYLVDIFGGRGAGSIIQVGVGRRRRWSDGVRRRIVAESYAPGAIVLEAARRHDISPQHLFAWHKAARANALSLPADAAPLFVPVLTDLHHDGGGRRWLWCDNDRDRWRGGSRGPWGGHDQDAENWA